MTANRNIAADQTETLRILKLINEGNLETLDGEESSWLDHSDAGGQLDRLLAFGVTVPELETTRGAIYQHFRHLKLEHGLIVVERNGVYRITVPK